MKIIIRIMGYSWKHFSLAVFVFVIFWHLFSVKSVVGSAEDKLLTALGQNVVHIEAAFLDNNAIELQKIFWQIKNDSIKSVKFIPLEAERGPWIFKEVVVGELTDRTWGFLNGSAKVVSNGAELGRLEYAIDLVDVNAAVLKQNYALFITVVVFFMGLLVLSNVGVMKTIFSIERCVAETNALVDAGEHSGIRDAIQRSLQSLPASLRGTPFAVLIERLAEVLQRASRLESELAVSKATSDLAAQVAHDIRSPLAALGAAAKGLDIPEEQRALVEGAVSRMKGIADDLLARYRAPGAAAGTQAGLVPQTAVKTEPCGLNGLTAQILAEKRLQHKEKAGVEFEFNSGSGELKADVDPKEFQRLISNLVNNAVEAFEKGGKVAVELSKLDGRVLLKISDNGKGVPPEILAKLGQKGETHGKDGGTGLGLYHARTTVESWGGSLKINSKPGEGTSITIELPAVAESASAAQPSSRQAILLDDDMLVHMNWKMAAKAAGMEFKAYKTPPEFYAALEALPKDSPIYIDSELGDGVTGEDIAKDLHVKGFTSLTMATGHGPEKFAAHPWLKVSGKEPPWR